MLDFLMESARSGFPTLPKLTDDDVDSIWASVSEFIEHQMAQQKGVNIPGLGTFTLSRHKIDVGNNKFILVQRPIFLLSEKFAQIHGLKYNKSFTTSDIPVVPLNFMALSFGCPFNRDTIEGCVKETLNVFSRSVATKQNVEFNFKGIGMLVTRDLKVKMRFYKDFINSLDGTGNLVKSLSNRPGTSDSVMSGRESTLLRPRSCSALIFPRVEVKDTEKTSPMDPIIEENGEVEWVTEGQKPNEKPEIEDEGERPNTCNRESSSTKRLLNRQCIVPAKVTGISLMEDLERIVKPKTAPARPSSSLSAHSNKADPEGDDHLNSVQRIRNPPSPVCQDHCRAGQELCYLCMQRAQKNIPVYFTEERRLKEQEEDRILQQYQHMKDQEALDKTQMESLATREQKQKDAAYNMGVAEAIRTQRNKRNTEIYRSYIFDKRPLTPPALIKQEQCFQSLVQQMTERRGKETKLKQDKELMDKLEQMQLAEEIAAQRAKYLKEKNEQMLCFKGALDTQVKLKPQFILSMGSEAAEPVFGRHDMTNDKLAEKRRRAQEVSIHQLQSSTERKRLATLNDLVQQRKEMEMLQKTKQELLSDRASQFEKINKFQMTLQDNWARSLEVKKHKEQEEEKFIKSGSHLLLDQCEKYRRCLQCKRRTTNCGETNIWRESRYIPGSRLMV
ncbi:coiled-coil domain-containing protein 81 [Bombina bombina]|uniref:coiled-coil domain-containing protein 81 n=1 Tax=Bombina bombina TaxID=8345 RepID=UPI00235A4FDC|nr:coiled-coil domain-containing protein 81 [Bombina bombina]